MDREASQATVHGIPNSWTPLSDFHFQPIIKYFMGEFFREYYLHPRGEERGGRELYF